MGKQCIHDVVHYDTYCTENIIGSILQAMGQSVAWGWVQKDVFKCQSYLLSGLGVLP